MKIDLTPLNDIPKVVKKLEIIDKKLDSNIEKRCLTTRELSSYTGYKFETIKSKIKNYDFIVGIHYYKKDSTLFFDKFEVDNWVMGIKPSNLISENNTLDIVDEVLASL